MSNGDLMATGQNPGATYTPTSGPYHEDRWASVSQGPGWQMFRVHNAKYDSTSGFWKPMGSGSPAYATVQNPDGSIHFFTQPAGQDQWQTWAGSGTNAVFNAVDFGLSTGDLVGTNNQAALQAAITTAFNAGGTLVIPSGTYHIAGTVNINFQGALGTDPGLVIAGTSGDTELVQQQNSFDLFSFTGMTSGRGVRIRDLRITFVTGGDAPPLLPYAIRCINSDSVVCERVFFEKCQALYTDPTCIQCGLFDCTIDYAYGTFNSATLVFFRGAENFIDHCVLRQQSRAASPNPGPTNCIGVWVQAGGGDTFIANSHISYLTTGIRVSSESTNLTHLFCSNLICENWTTALLIQPATSAGVIYQVFCDDCVFSRQNGSTDTTSTGVIINLAGGTNNANVSDIFLNNCMCFQWNVAGVQISGGQNIVITGGRYGSNAASPQTTGGISITGPAANITINGADLSPVVPGYGTQPFAISITAAVQGLYVRGCNLTLYGTNGPLHLSSPGTQIEITDCPGYNDQATVLTASGATPPSSQFQNYSSWTNAPSGWFGPIAFYVWGSGVTSIHIDGVQMMLSTGGFTLSPGEHASIDVGPLTTPSFMAVGK